MVARERLGRIARVSGVAGALGVAAVAVAVGRHLRHGAGRREHGGIVIADVGAYDAMSRLFLDRLFAGIAADVAQVVPAGARVLDLGCGPGLLSIRLARDYRLDVTGLDLDRAMVERAGANARRACRDGPRPSFVVGDAASLDFPDGSFDLVVSTMSMHHWDDPAAGLAEIGRVLRTGARALIWELRPGAVPFHARVPDPIEHLGRSSLRVIDARPWSWPWPFRFTRRIELIHADRTDG